VITERRTDEYVSDCVGKCKNGGVCQNGQCVCRDGFGGDFCVEEMSADLGGSNFLAFVSVALIIATLATAHFARSLTKKS
jgi:hypothetical protein